MTSVKLEKLPGIHLGLSPRGAPGVYRHSIRARLWPKSWSEDTQFASSGTLVINTPRDSSCDFRQELWSYQGENRGATRADLYHLPEIPFRFRSSFDSVTDGRSLFAAASSKNATLLPLIRLSTEESPRQVYQHRKQIQQQQPVGLTEALKSLAKENDPKQSENTLKCTLSVPLLSTRREDALKEDAQIKPKVEFGRNQADESHLKSISVPSLTHGSLTFRRYKSEEHLPTAVVKIKKWKSDRHLNVPLKKRNSVTKALISIVGKLPTVRKGMIKTLQALHKEKYFGERQKGARKTNVTPESDLQERVNQIDPENAVEDKAAMEMTRKEVFEQNLEKDRTVNNRKATGLNIKQLRGQTMKLNPPKTRTSGRAHPKAHTNSNTSTYRKPLPARNGDTNKLRSKDGNEKNKPENQENEQLKGKCQPLREPGDELADHVNWVQQAMENNAIIDSESYQEFAHKKSSLKSVKKSSDKGDNSSVATDNAGEG